MQYRLTPASESDIAWLDALRRDAYHDLFIATWGAWDESRHERHLAESLRRGNISIIEIDGVRVGMVQLFEDSGCIELAEIQVAPAHQGHGIGTCVLQDIVRAAHKTDRNVVLAVARKNVRAARLYRRLGFRQVAVSDTHAHMVNLVNGTSIG